MFAWQKKKKKKKTTSVGEEEGEGKATVFKIDKAKTAARLNKLAEETTARENSAAEVPRTLESSFPCAAHMIDPTVAK